MCLQYVVSRAEISCFKNNDLHIKCDQKNKNKKNGAETSTRDLTARVKIEMI